MAYKTMVTNGIFEKMKENPIFSGFIYNCLNRFFSGDFGSVSDPENNTEENKLAIYTFSDGKTIRIKQDYNIVTVLFPDEY